MALGVVRKRVTKPAIVFVNPRVGVASSRLRALSLTPARGWHPRVPRSALVQYTHALLSMDPPGRSLPGSALLGQSLAASLPRGSGPLQVGAPQQGRGGALAHGRSSTLEQSARGKRRVGGGTYFLVSSSSVTSKAAAIC
jgi:hypothetical protein